MSFQKRALRLVGFVLVVYALLVSTHLGEFWPFSIYPMFSQAGQPWSRAVVRELPSHASTGDMELGTMPMDSLPGTTYPLVPRGINQNDVANYVSKTTEWTDERIAGLRSLFDKRNTLSQSLLVARVRGSLVGDSVAVEATPVIIFAPDSTHLIPSPDD